MVGENETCGPCIECGKETFRKAMGGFVCFDCVNKFLIDNRKHVQRCPECGRIDYHPIECSLGKKLMELEKCLSCGENNSNHLKRCRKNMNKDLKYFLIELHEGDWCVYHREDTPKLKPIMIDSDERLQCSQCRFIMVPSEISDLNIYHHMATHRCTVLR